MNIPRQVGRESSAEKGPGIRSVLRHWCPIPLHVSVESPDSHTINWYTSRSRWQRGINPSPTYNVPALKEFFCWVFDIQIVAEPGDELAVLRNSDGFVLTLMYDKRIAARAGFSRLFLLLFLPPTR